MKPTKGKSPKESGVGEKILHICMKNIVFGDKGKTVYVSKIVPQIEKLLSQEKERVIGEIEKKKGKYSCMEDHKEGIAQSEGYDEALEDIKAILQNKIEEAGI